MSSMLVPPESSSAVLVMKCSKFVSICNRSRARFVDSSRNHSFWSGYPNVMHSYGGLLQRRGSKLALLKSTFNAENFICRLSWSISSDFDAVHYWNVCEILKSRQNSLKYPILGFKIVQGHRCWYPVKACQQCLLWCAASLCLSGTVLLLDWKIVAETARIEGGTQIWCTRTEDSLNVGGRTLHRWNIRLMRNISYAGCLGLSWMVSAQFTLIMCIASWNRKKFTKTPNFGVQGRSRSSMLVHRKCRQQCLLW